MLRVGCGGFPVGRSRYFQDFGTVEMTSTFYNPPQAKTAERWRAESPAGFEYSVLASQLITHSPGQIAFHKVSARISERRRPFCGHFRDTPEVQEAWERLRLVAEILGARFVVFETPASFYPEADHLRDMYRFFKEVRRGSFVFVWQPHRDWERGLIGRVCADLGLIHGVDPLREEPASRRGVRYFRLRGQEYAEGQLKELAVRCADNPAYVYFIHRLAYGCAKRFAIDVRHLRRL